MVVVGGYDNIKAPRGSVGFPGGREDLTRQGSEDGGASTKGLGLEAGRQG